MKSRKLRIVISVITLVFSLILTGCFDIFDDTYTVWTGTQTYSSFSAQFGTLNDGYYFSEELTDSEFNQISKSLSDNNKHSWTEEQIHDYLYKRGFGESEASNEAWWFISINHGWLCSRTGQTVYIIVK